MRVAPWTQLAFAAAMLAPPLLAQTAVQSAATHGAWSVFVAGSPQECYIVSQPTGSVARRDGQPVEVDRGDIRLFVRFNPAETVSNEVSFTGGYPFSDTTPVRVEIGSDGFELTPGQGDANGWAWPSPEDDAGIVAAMRRGSTAAVTGVSTRGTTTVDTFSLAGFTAAVGDAETRCR